MLGDTPYFAGLNIGTVRKADIPSPASAGFFQGTYAADDLSEVNFEAILFT